MKGSPALALSIACALVTTACSEPMEFADWLLDVPAGTPMREYAHVPRDQRDPGAISLVEDLVVGTDLTNPDTGLFQPSQIAASPEGDLFVSDFAMKRIQMYAPDGTHVRTLGREGQGPAEFESLWRMTIAGDRLVVDDRGNDRFSLWTLDGEHVAEHPKSTRATFFSTQGLRDRTFVSAVNNQTMDGGRRIVARYSLEGEEMLRFVELDIGPSVMPGPDWDAQDMMRAMVGLYRRPSVIVAVGEEDLVYLSPVRQYQLLALSAEGEVRWALRTDMRPPPWSVAQKQAEIERVTGGAGGISIDDVDWPDEFGAIDHIRTDGSGRVYVFLQHGMPFPENPDRWEVDVYSPDGDRLASGFLPEVWSYARGDFVYGVRTDPETDERSAVRYRLTLPGQTVLSSR